MRGRRLVSAALIVAALMCIPLAAASPVDFPVPADPASALTQRENALPSPVGTVAADTVLYKKSASATTVFFDQDGRALGSVTVYAVFVYDKVSSVACIDYSYSADSFDSEWHMIGVTRSLQQNDQFITVSIDCSFYRKALNLVSVENRGVGVYVQCDAFGVISGIEAYR